MRVSQTYRRLVSQEGIRAGVQQPPRDARVQAARSDVQRLSSVQSQAGHRGSERARQAMRKQVLTGRSGSEKDTAHQTERERQTSGVGAGKKREVVRAALTVCMFSVRSGSAPCASSQLTAP